MTCVSASTPAVFIVPAPTRRRMYGDGHPLSIPRVSLTLDLIRACGAIREDELLAARVATDAELQTFHDPAYLQALRHAQQAGAVAAHDRERFGLGTLENPWFEGVFDQPAAVAGAGVQAAEAVLAGRVAFNPAGGMHHARAARAEGFCYFNDPALSILRLREAGLRVLYLDIDAHHGDGVEAAFLDHPEVLTVSLHMDTTRAYPFRGGRLEDCGTGPSGWTTLNVPLPPGVNDAEYHLLFDAAWEGALRSFLPDAVVLQAGTDMLFCDPLGKLQVSTQGFLGVVERVLRDCPRHAEGTPRLLVTGGGGYHPLALARAWAGLWMLISGRPLPDGLPEAAAAVLRATGWDDDGDEPWYPRFFESLLDAPQQATVRDGVRALRRSLARHPLLAGARSASAAHGR